MRMFQLKCSEHRFRPSLFLLAALAALVLAPLARGADPWKASQILKPADLAKQLSDTKNKPLILQVGFLTLYKQSHIPDSKYCGPTSKAEGLELLRKCVAGVPHTKAIVIYCGCCPWQNCPNIRPAFAELSKLGFKNLKVLDIPNDYGKDWVSKGYPVASGE
jgi:thiosulfate/3-mercaptopyruvate sulfurtransferase